MLKIAVITISDRAASGEYEDRSGPRIRELIESSDLSVKVIGELVPDEADKIEQKLKGNADKDFIITTGGTGISDRDITPDVCRRLCEKELPGIAEMLRRESCKETPFAVFSRGFAGVMGSTIVVNFPGSYRAVSLCTKLLLPILCHGKDMLAGRKH